MLKHFFDISTGFRYKKMEKSSPSMYRDVHVVVHQIVQNMVVDCSALQTHFVNMLVH